MSIRSVLVAAAIAAASPSFAADRAESPDYLPVRTSGFYLGMTTGVTFVDRTSFASGGIVVRSDYDVDSYQGVKAGWALGRTLGVILPRVDVEVGYARNSVSRHTVGGVPFAGVDSFGETRAFQGFGSAYLDFDLGGAFRPFVGGGAGAADVRLRRQGVSETGTLIDSTDTAFAYHLDAGVGIDVRKLGILGDASFLDGTTVEVGYRFTDAPDLRFVARDGTPASGAYRTNAITLGTRKVF